MAISIRGGSPLVVATISNPVSGTLTGTQQPQAGDLLLIFHGNDFYAATAMPTPTVGGSTSGVTAITNGSADAGTNSAHIKAYTYVVGSTGDLTVSVTESAPGDEDKMLVVYVLAGADTTTPIDGGSAGAAGAFSATGQTSQVAPAVTPSGTDAFLIVHDNAGGGSATTSYTSPGSPFTELYDGNATGGMSYVGGTEQLSTSGSTGTRTFTAANAVPWAAVTVAIATAAGGGTPAIDLGLTTATWWPGQGPWGAERFVADPRSYDTDAPAVPLDVADTGSGSDDLSATATVPGADAGTAIDAVSVVASVALSEAGSAADAAVVAATAPLADTGSASDALSVTVGGTAITLSDAGSASDALLIAAATPLTDIGSAADAFAATAAVPIADAGGGTDQLAANATVQLADVGSVAETLAAGVPIGVADAGTATDALTVTVTAALTDTGSAADVVRPNSATPLGEPGSAADVLTVLVSLALADAAAAADALSVVRTINLTDTGSAADSVTAQQQTSSNITLTDSGSAFDRLCAVLHRPTSGTTTRPGNGTTTRPYQGVTYRG